MKKYPDFAKSKACLHSTKNLIGLTKLLLLLLKKKIRSLEMNALGSPARSSIETAARRTGLYAPGGKTAGRALSLFLATLSNWVRHGADLDLPLRCFDAAERTVGNCGICTCTCGAAVLRMFSPELLSAADTLSAYRRRELNTICALLGRGHQLNGYGA